MADVDGTREDGFVADIGGIVLVADVDGTREDGLEGRGMLEDEGSLDGTSTGVSSIV